MEGGEDRANEVAMEMRGDKVWGRNGKRRKPARSLNFYPTQREVYVPYVVVLSSCSPPCRALLLHSFLGNKLNTLPNTVNLGRGWSSPSA